MHGSLRNASIVAAASFMAACGGSKNLSGTGAGGTGSGATGGNPSGGSATGGLATGGSPTGGSGGSPGTGGVILFDAGVHDGADGPPVCDNPGGPLTTTGRPRPTFPWTLTSPNPDGGFSTSASTSGCHAVPGAYEADILCSGPATLRADSAGPTLTWPDGARLTWDPTGLPAGFTPPSVVGAAGAPGAADQQVWAQLARHSVVVCPVCGGYETRTMDIRESEGGPVLFMAREGVRLDDLPPAQVQEVFGAGMATVASCSFQTQAACNVLRRTNLDHLLDTIPVQAIPHAVMTRVITPKGTFDVIWHASIDTAVGYVNNCADGPGIANDTGFLASRVSRVSLFDQP